MKNILFITADQWRGECLSCLGHRVRTPHLDSLAAEGMLFKRHYANAVPCGPSRACLHTGMYLQNHRSGTNGTPLDARHSNWALEVRKHGYDPVLFGYTDTTNDPRNFPPEHKYMRTYEGPLPGINPVVMMGTFPDAWAKWLAAKGYPTPAPNWKLYTAKQDGTEYESGGSYPLALDLPREVHDTHYMVDQVIDYIGAQNQSWIVHLSLLRPHPPWVAPEPYNQLHPPGELMTFNRQANAEVEAEQHPFLRHYLNRPHFAAPTDDRRTARLKASYFGLMTEVDDNLGRLFNYLQQTGQWQHTLIVFTSDHGEQLGDHWLIGKTGYFDESYHIPLIIRDPYAAESQGVIVSHFTENIDIMPTLLDWLDIEIPRQCDGCSLRPTLQSGKVPIGWRDAVHWEYDFRDIPNGRAMETELGLTPDQCNLNVIRDETSKYVHFNALPPLFFDLEKDPSELVNQASNPNYLPRILEYAQKLISWRMTHEEQTLTHIALTDQGVMSRT